MTTHAQLAPNPAFDPSYQRGRIIRHAAEAVAPLGGVGGGQLALVPEALLAAGPTGERQAVRVEWLDTPRPANPAIRVELAGRDVSAPAEPVGDSGLRLLVPAVDAPTPIQVTITGSGTDDVLLSATLAPVRRYEVHLVQHSHYDIGYTDRQETVRRQHSGYLDAVLRLIRDTDDLPDEVKFRWSEEALYAVTEWLASRSESARAEFFQRVAEGRISLSAMPFNLHTEMCSTDELHELLRPALELKHRHGIEFRGAMQTDVPGHVVGLPDALASLGVEYLSVAHNWAGRSAPNTTGQLALPRLFRWQGPSGGSVVVWRADTPHGLCYMEGPLLGFHESYEVAAEVVGAYLHALGNRPFPLPAGSIFGWLDDGVEVSSRQPYPYDIVHLRTHGRWSDNAGPSRVVSDIAAAWNERWLAPKLRVSTNEAFFDAAMDRVGELPTWTGDWNDWWAHGVGAAAAPVAIGRRAQHDLADAQTLHALARLGDPEAPALFDGDEGYRQLALWDEHTWGAANSWEHEDHGPSSGEHQWYWKVARAYAAADESERGLELAAAALATPSQAPSLAPGSLVGRALGPADAAASVYAWNTTGQSRSSELVAFLPASVVALDQPIELRDGRSGEQLPHVEWPEEAANRGLGRYLRSRLRDVPAAGFVRLDVQTADSGPAPAEPLDDPCLLENEFLRARIDLATGTISSLVEKATGREVVNADSAFGFNAYLYDRYATVGRSNHNSSKFADNGSRGLISSREVAGAAALISASADPRGQQVVLEQRVGGADWLRISYRLPAGLPWLEITNRLRKPSTWDKESAYFAFPFAANDPVLHTESAGGLTGPAVAQVPGGAEYLRTIRGFVSIADGDQAAAWVSADAPLVQLGTVALPYVPFPTTLTRTEPATVFSWVHNNIWDTNFPVEQSFEMDFRYRVAVGSGDAPALASAAAADLVRPLRPVVAEGRGARAEGADGAAEGSWLSVDDPRVQLVGLRRSAEDRVVVRLVSYAPDGVSTRLVLPPGATAAWSCSYLGEPGTELVITDGAVPVDFPGSGVAAVLVAV